MADKHRSHKYGFSRFSGCCSVVQLMGRSSLLCCYRRISFFARKRVLYILAACALAIFFLAAFPWTTILTHFLEWIKDIGWTGNLLLVLGFVLVSFPFMMGYMVLALGAGFLYGIVIGTATVACGSTTGACVAFAFFRRVKCKSVEVYLEQNPQISRFLREFDNNRFSMALLARMVPIPFGFSNAILAMTSITFREYFWSTFLGLLPLQFLWSYLGSTLRSFAEIAHGRVEGSPGQMASLVVQLMSALVVPIYFAYKFSKSSAVTPEDIELRDLEEGELECIDEKEEDDELGNEINLRSSKGVITSSGSSSSSSSSCSSSHSSSPSSISSSSPSLPPSTLPSPAPSPSLSATVSAAVQHNGLSSSSPLYISSSSLPGSITTSSTTTSGSATSMSGEHSYRPHHLRRTSSSNNFHNFDPDEITPSNSSPSSSSTSLRTV